MTQVPWAGTSLIVKKPPGKLLSLNSFVSWQLRRWFSLYLVTHCFLSMKNFWRLEKLGVKKQACPNIILYELDFVRLTIRCQESFKKSVQSIVFVSKRSSICVRYTLKFSLIFFSSAKILRHLQWNLKKKAQDRRIYLRNNVFGIDLLKSEIITFTTCYNLKQYMLYKIYIVIFITKISGVIPEVCIFLEVNTKQKFPPYKRNLFFKTPALQWNNDD